MRAGTCRKISASGKQLHSLKIDLLISPAGRINCLARLGECRRIQDYVIKRMVFLLSHLCKHLENILADIIDLIRKPVPLSIRSGHLYGL